MDPKPKIKNFRDIKDSIILQSRTPTNHSRLIDFPLPPLHLDSSQPNSATPLQEKLSFKLLQTQRNEPDSLVSNYHTNPVSRKQPYFISPSKNNPQNVNNPYFAQKDLSNKKKQTLQYYRPSNYQTMLQSKQCHNKQNNSSYNLRDTSKNSNKSDSSDSKGRMLFAGLAHLARNNNSNTKDSNQNNIPDSQLQNNNSNKKGQFSRFSKLAQCTSREKDHKFTLAPKNLDKASQPAIINTTRVSTTPPKPLLFKNISNDCAPLEAPERPKTPPPRVLKETYVKQHSGAVLKEQVIAMLKSKGQTYEQAGGSKQEVSQEQEYHLNKESQGRKESIQSELDEVNVSRSMSESQLDMNPYF